MKDIVIFGTGNFAEIATEYFNNVSDMQVIAYTRTTSPFGVINGIDIYNFNNIEEYCSPDRYYMFVAVGYGSDFNSSYREEIVTEAVKKGYTCICYKSPDAFVWSNVDWVRANNFIFENNIIQPFVIVGKGNVIWSGNHIGHHSVIGNYNFISSHCVISGNCKIGDNNFIGVNSTIIDGIKIGNKCIIGAGSLVLKDVPDNTKVIGIWK